MPNTTQHYTLGHWTTGSGEALPQYHALTGEVLYTVQSEGLDYAEILDYARRIGNPALRQLTFPQRGQMLKALALYLMERKERYYEISHQTGATRADSWVDIEGGIGNLFANASLRRRFPDETYHVEGETIRLSKENTFVGHHILTPKRGVAIHINAFNFPIWGMLEKVACNLMAGMPAVVKPSEQTSFLTEAMFRDIIASGILPEGALQLVSGTGRGILDFVESQDVATFTGSAATGRKLRVLPSIINHSVPFTIEADSLNAAILGEDAVPGTPTTMWFTPKYTTKQMAEKTGKPNFAYEISCDQMCGQGHWSMKGVIIVETQEEFDEIMLDFESRLEIARAKVDRIAFSGQVPCNVYDAQVGDYIIPVQTEDGKITGQPVSDPTFEQYTKAVGKVWKIMEDGWFWYEKQ